MSCGNLSIISFTERGNEKNRELLKALKQMGYCCSGYTAQRYRRLSEEKPDGRTNEQPDLIHLEQSLGMWTGEQFSQADGLIFIGAAGIAVRAIAPYVRDKFQDPAVVVMDEQADFVIPLLSGHVGGANELAMQIAEITGAVPVLTTATDVNRKFAVDVFAKKQNLVITNRKLAKEISAAILKGESVGLFSDFPIEGQVPEELTVCYGQTPESVSEKDAGKKQEWNRSVWITCQTGENSETVLRLVPKELVLGIGCRRGIAKEVIRRQVEEVFFEYGLDLRGVAAVASIDLKKEEPGLLDYAKELGVSFLTYSAEQLEQAEGSFQESSFVEGITGVGNVCERAAVTAAKELELAEKTAVLLVKKQAGNGVTVAVAQKNRKVVING